MIYYFKKLHVISYRKDFFNGLNKNRELQDYYVFMLFNLSDIIYI